jgi:serine/threonine protein kinase
MQVCAECGQRYDHGGYCPADGTPLVETDDPLLGTEVGRYRLARLLGEGGMGRVYMAVQPMIGSRVAIKLLDETCARSPELLERFFAEARAVNLIRHENIVGVIDLAQLADGRPYIVMEFIDGATLGDLVRGGPLVLGGVVQVMSEVLSALHAAHAIGIVHRDLKPDNIVVTGEGHAKVLDFGIAKLAPSLGNAMSPRTRTGALLGTPAYMAPEQITGSGNIDPRTDIYAAGVVLFEAVTGRTPFQTETLFDLMKAHLEQQPPMPRSLRPDLPVEIEQVILCALAKRPEQRFANAGAMAVALDAAAVRLPPDQRRALSSRGGVFSGRVPSTGRGRDVPPAMQATVPATPVAKRRGKRNWIAIGLLAAAAIATLIVLVVLRGDDTAEVAHVDPTPVKHEEPPPREAVRARYGVAEHEAPPVVADKPVDKPTVVAKAEPAPANKLKKHDAPAPAAPVPASPPPTTVAQLGPGEREVPPPAGVHVEGNVHFIVKDPLSQTGHPADYNPKRFDPIAYLPKAEALARQVLPDAQLTSLEFDPVYPDGHVELTGRDHEYDFRSPSKSARPVGTPKNVKLDAPCLVHIEVMPTQIVAQLRTSETCTEKIVRRPRCSFAQVWAIAKAAHKVDNDMIARVGWFLDETWFFDTDPDTIRNGGGVNSFADQCP